MFSRNSPRKNLRQAGLAEVTRLQVEAEELALETARREEAALAAACAGFLAAAAAEIARIEAYEAACRSGWVRIVCRNTLTASRRAI